MPRPPGPGPIRWHVAVVARPPGDSPADGLVVEVSSWPVSTPAGLSLAEALGRLEPAVAPFESVVVTVVGLEQLGQHPATWVALRQLPPCVSSVDALGLTFDLRSPAGAGLWRLALRLVERSDGDGADDRRGA